MKKLLLFGFVIILLILVASGLYFLYELHNKNKLVIQTHSGSVSLVVEVADTLEKQMQGLMFRQEMSDNAGMLFVFSQFKMVYMWMKNTYIPLDMIFFDETGKITHIHLNAKPHDESIISSGVPAKGVVEVNAGFVEKHHISVGQQIRHAVLNFNK